MLAQLKELALDPCNSNVSHQKVRPLWNQMLKVRDAMALANNDISWRKRKLQQFVKGQLRSPPGLPAEKSNQKSKSKLSRGHFSHASGISCLLNSVNTAKSSDRETFLSSDSACSLLTFVDNIQEQLPSEFSLHNDGIDFGPKGFSSLVDSDESVTGSDLVSHDNRTASVASLLTLDDAAHNSSLLFVKGSRSRPLQPLCQSPRLLNFIGDHLQRFVIPVGPRFQADVPDWTVPAGTTVCVKRHVSEERRLLQCELGPAFFSWKFDEMGEQVSKAWSFKEAATFESLVKRKPQLNGKSFLNNALKSLPQKNGKTIINYYFNVFIPRQLSLQNRSSNKLVNISDDIADDINDICLHKGSKGQKPQGLKSQYLRRPI
ncbi:uncharacterized protein LOC132630696 isoform X2 [Lycium barbarum]|uniref:uncharacterized protein LOC132630696 isoform X2 n=1 Tax=Lycium barbarum TaxID=112863 RepID=UPI00293E096D|nr:uncharacterized protein LOC132630696 isoform X2 [Lycium barbarum]